MTYTSVVTDLGWSSMWLGRKLEYSLNLKMYVHKGVSYICIAHQVHTSKVLVGTVYVPYCIFAWVYHKCRPCCICHTYVLVEASCECTTGINTVAVERMITHGSVLSFLKNTTAPLSLPLSLSL